MAFFRNIQISFWTDTKIVDDFTPEDRYFYLYLFTNPHTNLCGCYELSLKQAAVETGYELSKIEMLIGRFESVHKVLVYSCQTKELLLINWHKYNWTKSDKFLSGLAKQIEQVKNPDFKQYLIALVRGNDTVSIPYQFESHTVSQQQDKPKKQAPAKPQQVQPTQFEEFWQVYPRKDEKAAARTKYLQRLKDGYSPRELIEAARQYAAQCSRKHTEKQYIKMARTFLGPNGPIDEYLKERRSAADLQETDDDENPFMEWSVENGNAT